MIWLAVLFAGVLLVFFFIESDYTVGKGVAFGLFLSAFGVAVSVTSVQKANEQYAAANRQDIDISVDLLDGPVVTQPCHIQLEVTGSRLVLPGSVRQVTPDMVNAICGKEG